MGRKSFHTFKQSADRLESLEGSTFISRLVPDSLHIWMTPLFQDSVLRNRRTKLHNLPLYLYSVSQEILPVINNSGMVIDKAAMVNYFLGDLESA